MHNYTLLTLTLKPDPELVSPGGIGLAGETTRVQRTSSCEELKRENVQKRSMGQCFITCNIQTDSLHDK